MRRMHLPDVKRDASAMSKWKSWRSADMTIKDRQSYIFIVRDRWDVILSLSLSLCVCVCVCVYVYIYLKSIIIRCIMMNVISC